MFSYQSLFSAPIFPIPSFQTTPPIAIASSTHTAFATTQTAFVTMTSPNMNQAPPATPSASIGISISTSTIISNSQATPGGYTSPPYQDTNQNGPDEMGPGVKGGIAVSALIFIVIVIFLSFWFCCGGHRKWKKSRVDGEQRGLPLHNVNNPSVPHGPNAAGIQARGEAPPPRYEEVVPPQHQRLAGGMPVAHVRNEEDEGMIADGKTPLSEIPFEDVVLDRTPSGSSSSQSFSMARHAGSGDTTGHTNS